MMVLTEVLNKV